MPPLHAEFFYFGICHFCKSSSDIQRCGSCKTVAYCSKQHQKSDWKSHKELCKVITRTSKTMASTKNLTFEQWKNFRITCHMTWMNALKRPLQVFECQMWMFPRTCAVCFSKDDLVDCTDCHNVAYCSLAHMQEHKSHSQFCSRLKLCLDIDRYLAKTNSYPQIELKHEFSSGAFPKNMEALMRAVEGSNQGSLERILRADAIAPGAIIRFAIEVSKQSAPNLIIHVVGASAPEATADWLLASELLFHYNSSLQQIRYVFIGPEAWSMLGFDLGAQLCQTCRENRRVLKMDIYKELYHEVDGLEKPSLVVSFNSGLHEFEGQSCDDWKESIPLLVKDAPFVFTAYTEEEMLKDLDRIKAVTEDVSVLVCDENPFASPRPIRDWCTENIPVFYSSGFIAIVERVSKSDLHTK